MRFALLLILVLISFSLISNTDAGPNPSKDNGYHWIGKRFLNKKRLLVKQIFK
jgi:hypothetical protein